MKKPQKQPSRDCTDMANLQTGIQCTSALSLCKALWIDCYYIQYSTGHIPCLSSFQGQATSKLLLLSA